MCKPSSGTIKLYQQYQTFQLNSTEGLNFRGWMTQHFGNDSTAFLQHHLIFNSCKRQMVFKNCKCTRWFLWTYSSHNSSFANVETTTAASTYPAQALQGSAHKVMKRCLFIIVKIIVTGQIALKKEIRRFETKFIIKLNMVTLKLAEKNNLHQVLRYWLQHNRLK